MAVDVTVTPVTMDVACGAGLFCHLASQREATVAGVDISAAMPPPAPGAPNPRRLHQEGVLDLALEQAGLRVEKTVDVDTPWVYPDEETALRGILSYAPGQRAIRASGKERVHAAVREGIKSFRTESGGYVLRNKSLYLVLVPASV